MMELPVYTEEIFKLLSGGKFISSNTSDASLKRLFSILEEDGNFERLRDYFSHIGFELQAGNEYYYFSRKETKVDLERKIAKAYEWIDVLDFLKNFNNSFGAGFRFSQAEILNATNTNIDLETKLNNLENYAKKKDHPSIVKYIVDKLEKESFIELENEIKGEYKVLNSFHYLEQIIQIINIPEEVENEIPE